MGAENQIEITARTAAGSLRWELERYITGVLATNKAIKARFNVPWADVKAHIRASFLNVDESSALHDEVEKTRKVCMSRELASAAGSGKSLTPPTRETAEVKMK